MNFDNIEDIFKSDGMKEITHTTEKMIAKTCSVLHALTKCT